LCLSDDPSCHMVSFLDSTAACPSWMRGNACHSHIFDPTLLPDAFTILTPEITEHTRYTIRDTRYPAPGLSPERAQCVFHDTTPQHTSDNPPIPRAHAYIEEYSPLPTTQPQDEAAGCPPRGRGSSQPTSTYLLGPCGGSSINHPWSRNQQDTRRQACISLAGHTDTHTHTHTCNQCRRT
jgi:hypothetical protein